jgi:hypothetical protein
MPEVSKLYGKAHFFVRRSKSRDFLEYDIIAIYYTQCHHD